MSCPSGISPVQSLSIQSIPQITRTPQRLHFVKPALSPNKGIHALPNLYQSLLSLILPKPDASKALGRPVEQEPLTTSPLITYQSSPSHTDRRSMTFPP